MTCSQSLSVQLSSHQVLSPVTMIFVILLSYLPLAFVLAQDGQITCSIPPVGPHQDIALTCHFPEDLNVTKKDFSIYHYSANIKPESVIDCSWMNDTLNCFVNDGYKYNRTVTSQLTVTLSHVSTAQSGTYACQVAGYRPSSFGTCKFENKQIDRESRIACSILLVQPGEDAVLTCHFPEDLNVTKKDFSVYYYTKSINPEAVLDCWWITGILRCFVNPGYKYSMTVNTQLTLNISHVMSTNTGTYACQIARYRPSSFGTCQIESRQSNSEKKIACFTPHVQRGEDLSLTCRFPEDLSVARKEFSVYHVTEDAKQYAVVDCWWSSDKLKCISNPGYEYNQTDDTNVIVTIRRATMSHTGIYVCEIAGYKPSSLGICHLQISHDTKEEPINKTSFAIGAACAFAAAAVVITVLVIIYRKRICIRQKSDIEDHEEEQPLVPLKSKDKEERQDNESSLPKTFEEHLQTAVEKLYQNLFGSYYFVPPIYFNKTRYKKKSIAGKDIYVPDETDPRDAQHDGAMQHVLYCLRHMAEQQQEHMFVLTQFKYEDYLSSPVPGCTQHSLPMPSGLSEEENNVDCFDLLVVHRRHGVLVGVVKAVSDKDTESKNSKQETEESVVSQISEAVKQLEKAETMIKYLMSDEHLELKYTLILPNLSSLSLEGALKDPVVVQKLRDYLGVAATKDPTEICLCAEHLSDSNTPWNVSPDVVRNIQQRWGWTTESDNSITPEQYVSIIARFFGPATLSTLQVPEDCIKFQLPKTMAEAVSLTGDLYELSVLHPGLITRLGEPKVCLVGTPNTGKTRMLSVVGGKWLSEGHDVFIVEDTSFQNDPFLSNYLKSLSENGQRGSRAECSYGNVYNERCNLISDKSINECIRRIIEWRDYTRICILLDVAHLKPSHIKTFCTRLQKTVSDSNLYLWISCTGGECPPIGYCMFFTEIFNCPPAVVRELAKVKGDTGKHTTKRTAVVCPSSTDGPPVKYFTFAPNDSLKCGREVGRFLAQELLIGRAGNSRNFSMLKCSDVLILFENEDANFLIGLSRSNIRVEAAEKNNEVYLTNVDSALAMNVRRMETCRVKRKVVVYIENHRYPWLVDKNNKQRALTSCTSQLILVQQKKK